MKSRRICTLAFALALLPVTSACSGSDNPAAMGVSGSSAVNSAGAGGAASAAGGSSSAGSATAGHTSAMGTAGMGVVVGDGKLFVPEGITYSLVEGGRDLTLISATLIDNPAGDSFWIFAVRNDERDPICQPQVNVVFAAQSDDLDYGQAIVYVQAAMYRPDTVERPCLKPGEVGMGGGVIDWPDRKAMKIGAIDYQPRGYLYTEAVKLPDLDVGTLAIESSSAGNVVTGKVMNHTGSAAGAPVEVTIFPLDSAGRPTDFGYARSEVELAAGASWTFTTTIPSPINQYAAFAVYGQSDRVE